MVAALIYPTLSERNERKLILLILSELSESSFRSGTRDVVLPGWLVYKERLGRDAVSTADRNIAEKPARIFERVRADIHAD